MSPPQPSLLPAWMGEMTPDQLIRAVTLLVVGLAAAWVLNRVLRRALQGRWAEERSRLMRRLTVGTVVGLVAASALSQLGFDLSVLLGAAGVLTVAVGFASQTSASNIISGLFLIAEQPFSVGDIVNISGTDGEVLAIDLLSTKIRTFQNTFVRVPNETVMKASITNITRFPIRRIDIGVELPPEVDLRVLQLELIEALNAVHTVLAEPAPNVLLTGLSPAGVSMNVVTWTARENFVTTRTEVIFVLREFLQQRELWLGAQRIRLVGNDPAPSA